MKKLSKENRQKGMSVEASQKAVSSQLREQWPLGCAWEFRTVVET